MTTQTYQPNEFIYNSTWCFDPAIDKIMENKELQLLYVFDFIGFIIKIVCKYLNVNEKLLYLNTRKKEIVEARYICMYFASKKTTEKDYIIGKRIGNKNRCTVLHAIKTVNNQKETNRIFKIKLEDIEKRL